MIVELNSPDNALLVVAKRPAAGQTKTRLSPPLEPRAAAALYECFLRDTLELVRQVPFVRPVIAYSPQGEEAYFHRLAPGFELLLQTGDSLGARLDHATTTYLRRGCRGVVIMDSDSPTLPAVYLSQAFEALARPDVDVVIGPCEDGGYYLIGIKRLAPRLLREVRMSTPRVTRDTLALAEQDDLRVHLLPAWYDVDDSASLERLRSELAKTDNNSTLAVAPFTRRFLSGNSHV